MEKYGVEEQPEKTADEKKPKDVCPDCGSKLEDTNKTGILKCPVDGSKPFEK